VDTERPDCFCKSFSGVFFAIARDLCVISSFYEVFCNLLYIHRVELMNASRPFGVLPLKKGKDVAKHGLSCTGAPLISTVEASCMRINLS
jgi:hypothetical protein